MFAEKKSKEKVELNKAEGTFLEYNKKEIQRN